MIELTVKGIVLQDKKFFECIKNQKIKTVLLYKRCWFSHFCVCLFVKNIQIKFLLAFMKPLTKNPGFNPLQKACSGLPKAAGDSEICPKAVFDPEQLFLKPAFTVNC
jgi:hypothetical protein